MLSFVHMALIFRCSVRFHVAVLENRKAIPFTAYARPLQLARFLNSIFRRQDAPPNREKVEYRDISETPYFTPPPATQLGALDFSSFELVFSLLPLLLMMHPASRYMFGTHQAKLPRRSRFEKMPRPFAIYPYSVNPAVLSSRVSPSQPFFPVVVPSVPPLWFRAPQKRP